MHRARGVTTVLAVLAGVLTGCGWFGGADAIEVGSCLHREAPDEDGASADQIIDCDRPHDLQVVGLLDTRELGSSFPGETAVSRWAFSHCAEAFEDYLGVAYGRSALDLEIDAPGEDDWGSGRREIRCAVSRPDGRELVGSLRP